MAFKGSNQKIVFVTGKGGVGKSLIAASYSDVRYMDPQYVQPAPIPQWTARFNVTVYPAAYDTSYDYHHRTLLKV